MTRFSRYALWFAGSSLLTACGSDDQSLGQLAGSGGAGFGGSGGFQTYTGGFVASGGLVGQGGIIAAGGVVGGGGFIGSGGLVGAGGSGGLVGAGGERSRWPDDGRRRRNRDRRCSRRERGWGIRRFGSRRRRRFARRRIRPDASTDASVTPEGGTPREGGSDGAVPPVCIGTTTAIALTGAGTLSGSAQGDTSHGASRVAASICDGSSKGDGPDLVYSFTLDRPRDVTVSVTAGFDAILRSWVDKCGTPLNEPGGDACANAAAGSEKAVFPGLAAGTYYVVVDGAGASDKGTFTVTVQAVCSGIDQLRLVELGIGATNYTVIRNMSDCPAEVGGVKVFFDDSVATDLTTTLPAVTLPPGGELRIQENLGSSVPGAVDAGGTIPFQFDRGGTVRLCKSDCSKAGDILDVLMFADGDTSTLDSPPTPPSPVKFATPVTGITSANQNTKSWVRVGTGGKNPNFLGSDWCTGDPGAVFGLRLDEVFVGGPDFIAIKNHADCVVSLSPFRATIISSGSNPVNAVMDNRNVVVAGRVFVSETPIQAGDINVGAIQLHGGGAGTVQLCRGACATAGTTIDAIAFDGAGTDGGTVPFPPLGNGLTFVPNGLTAVTVQNQNTTSYQRAALAGRTPRFLASDWKTAAKTR